MNKLSIYTFLFQADGKNYLFNTQSLVKAEITDNLYDILIRSDFEKLDNNTLSILVKKHVIVDEKAQYDFYNEMATKTNILNFDSSAITLYLMPTIGCNFVCPYCFEGEKKQKSMSDKTIDDIIKFINLSSAKSLSLHWYGGEPLTRFDLMKKIYQKITDETSVEISDHNIITNGYLINDEILGFFHRTKLNNIQITLDGNRETHNSKRFDKDTGEGSFDKLLENIRRLSKELPQTKINVRVNVDKQNYKDFVPLYAFVHNECDCNNNVFIYPALIKDYSNDGNSHSRCFANEDIFSLYYFYKCIEDANNPKRIIGFINSKAIMHDGLLFRYINEGSQFSRTSCKDCLCFPLCFGGCAKDYLHTKYHGGKFNNCHPLKNKEKLKQAFLEDIHTSKDKSIQKNYIIDIY